MNQETIDFRFLGSKPPVINEVAGREAITFMGRAHGNSYVQLPEDLFEGVSDHTGFAVSVWVYLRKGGNMWERIFDFGKGSSGPYIFMTRNLRSVCFAGEEIAVDPLVKLQADAMQSFKSSLKKYQGLLLREGII